MTNNDSVFTKILNCAGCNKCILKCPTKANKASWVNEHNIVEITNEQCIACGECIDICDHNARDYIDDIEIFFNDIKAGKEVSMIVAPAAKTNFTNLPKIIGYLKSLGVNFIYDVSFGADITTWAYLKKIETDNIQTLIAQPCPVVVSYVEKFKPELIPYLAPIQSPAICLAIYLKKYLNSQDNICFLSPCVAKRYEIYDDNTFGNINYNITFSKLEKYFIDNNINLDEYDESEIDTLKENTGFLFPRPGGLSENIRLHFQDKVWTHEVEGIFEIEEYLKQYYEDIQEKKPVPLLIDALNCKQGCNIGTGTNKNIKLNFINHKFNSKKKEFDRDAILNLNKYLDQNLNLNDFIREYEDKSDIVRMENKMDIDDIFFALGKNDEESRKINCFSCGYSSCYEFAKAISFGNNHINNCHFFLLKKFKSLSSIDSLTGLFNRYSYNVMINKLISNHPKSLAIVFVDINGLKEVNDNLGHECGDRLITNASNILKRIFINNIYRVGGDEFIILEDNITLEDIENKVKTLKTIIKYDTSVSLSLGYSISKNTDELNDKINEAEKNMYKEKNLYYTDKKRR